MTLGLTAGAVAAERSFPQAIQVENKALSLNGVGTRMATIFKVKVYRAALYLEKKSADAEEILSSSQMKQVELLFLRDVSLNQIRNAWREGLERNCGSLCESTKPSVDQLVGLMTAMKDGDTMTFVFRPDYVNVFIRDRLVGKVAGAPFERIVLSTWLGNPPNSELKDGMLGR
ncbi:MAG: chalcone isomerase family protein [Oligoflexia bacterium]|nr:chalcone isomerase family protein [Oligoflexia bacterium]